MYYDDDEKKNKLFSKLARAMDIIPYLGGESIAEDAMRYSAESDCTEAQYCITELEYIIEHARYAILEINKLNA